MTRALRNITFRYFLYGWLFLSLSVACDTDPVVDVPVTEEEPMSLFAFYRKNNAGLTEDVELLRKDSTYTGILPSGSRINEMIASFELGEGMEARIGEELQVSGVSINDFSKPVFYRVERNGELIREYRVDVDFTYILPVIHIQTQDMVPITSKHDYVNATIKVEGKDVFDDLAGNIQIRGRGNSTWFLHPKKPYQIKFEEKKEMLGMPEDKRWLLLAEYSDKSFLRNRIAYEWGHLSRLDWSPSGEFAILYLNGQNQGLYHVSQKVEESSNRVDIGDEGFLLEVDQLERLDQGDIYFYSDHFLLNIKEPDLTEMGAPYEYIRQFIDDFESALFGSNFKDPTFGYRKFVEPESVADWFVINEIAKNVDAKWFASIFMHVVPGERMKFGPIWDFDLGYGNVDYADSQHPEGWWVRENAWIKRMLQDPYFRNMVKERYAYFRSYENVIYEKMDVTVVNIYDAVQENEEIWHTFGRYVWPNPVIFNTYEEEVDYVKQWISLRLAWMDSNINYL